jgi:general secretion pathway protein A
LYEQYWGVTEPPFSLTPNPKFLYLSEKHANCLTMLEYTVTRNKGAGMITGEAGCGKTTLSRALLARLDPNKFDVGMIVNPTLTPNQLLAEILEQFGAVSIPRQKRELVNALNALLLGLYRNGKKAVLLIDEAHLIRGRLTFEEIRMLLNFQLQDEFLLTLLLLGQPELRPKIDRIEALKQRMAVRYHLESLNRQEMEEMMRFRLKAAWYMGGDIFLPEAYDEIYSYSKGVPRVTCEIADNAMIFGMLRGMRQIDGVLMKEVIMDFEGKEW